MSRISASCLSNRACAPATLTYRGALLAGGLGVLACHLASSWATAFEQQESSDAARAPVTNTRVATSEHNQLEGGETPLAKVKTQKEANEQAKQALEDRKRWEEKNLRISEKVKPEGYHYVPDPSSQKACTIGGNVAENSGGPHTLKYGVTVNHVLGLEMVLPNGEVVELGGKHFPILGPDLLALMIGSEGTFGIVTKITCRLTPNPEWGHFFHLLGPGPS